MKKILFGLLTVLLSCSNPTDVIKNLESQDVELKLKSLGIELTTAALPIGNYVNAVRSGKLLFLSGKGPKRPAIVDGKPTDGSFITGKLGKDLTTEQGYQAARFTGIMQLSVLKAELGSLNRVKRIVKVLGMVNAVPEFTDHAKVINGYSDLMVEVFGGKGNMQGRLLGCRHFLEIGL